jgi:hypothetical protein
MSLSTVGLQSCRNYATVHHMQMHLLCSAKDEDKSQLLINPGICRDWVGSTQSRPLPRGALWRRLPKGRMVKDRIRAICKGATCYVLRPCTVTNDTRIGLAHHLAIAAAVIPVPSG